MRTNPTTDTFPWNAPGKRCFFCGIGGAGMNPLAHLLARRGVTVSGSDSSEQSTLDALRAAGVACHVGHKAAHVDDADVFVYSSAISADNPEWQRAKKRGITCLHRAELLARLVNGARGVTIAGTHGKTTVSALTALLFEAGGLDPTAVIGGFVPHFGAYFRGGESDWVVIETDESDGSFQQFVSEIAVLLNIDADHMDYYNDMDDVIAAFANYATGVKPRGAIVYNADDENVRTVVSQLASDVALVSCALDSKADFTARSIRLNGLTSTFIVKEGENRYPIVLGVPGRHNVLNALQAIAAARTAGVSIDAVRRGCRSFYGVRRRFQILGEFRRATVIDDYAHHPHEIAATLATARAMGRPVLAVFQPHRYTRTEKLMDEFVAALCEPQRLILTEIYSASEDETGVTGETLFQSVRTKRDNVKYVPDLAQLPAAVEEMARPGDVILFLGAGSISQVAHKMVES